MEKKKDDGVNAIGFGARLVLNISVGLVSVLAFVVPILVCLWVAGTYAGAAQLFGYGLGILLVAGLCFTAFAAIGGLVLESLGMKG